jgi:hypothetical protein
MATSPAVVLLVVQDTRAEGQVTERALNLVALNSLLASIVTTILLASVHLEAKGGRGGGPPASGVSLPRLAGARRRRGKRRAAHRAHRGEDPDLHFTLIAGMVIGAVGFAIMLKLSVILALLAFGLFSRNDARSHDLLNVNLGASSRLLYIVLFVITGASLPVSALVVAGGAGLALALARFAGKFVAVVALAPFGHLRLRQAAGSRSRSRRLHVRAAAASTTCARHTRIRRRLADVPRRDPGDGVRRARSPCRRARIAGETAPDDDVGTHHGPPCRAHSRRAEGLARCRWSSRVRASLARRRARAHGAEHARLQPRARRARPPRAPGEGRPRRRGEARDHREHDRGELRGERDYAELLDELVRVRDAIVVAAAR